jgi:hypothetical protein
MKNPLANYPKKTELGPDGKPRHWGMFGYESELVRQIVARDDVPAMQEVLRLGYVHKDSKCFLGGGMHKYCIDYNAPKCAALFEGATA